MPYLTGTKYDFENRFHSLPSGMSDLIPFSGEAATYIVSGDIKQKWNDEFRHNYYEFSGVWYSGNFVA